MRARWRQAARPETSSKNRAGTELGEAEDWWEWKGGNGELELELELARSSTLGGNAGLRLGFRWAGEGDVAERKKEEE